MKPIVVDGTTYVSVIDAWRHFYDRFPNSDERPTLAAVRWRLKHGWTNEEAFFTPYVAAVERRNWKAYRVSPGA